MFIKCQYLLHVKIFVTFLICNWNWKLSIINFLIKLQGWSFIVDKFIYLFKNYIKKKKFTWKALWWGWWNCDVWIMSFKISSSSSESIFFKGDISDDVSWLAVDVPGTDVISVSFWFWLGFDSSVLSNERLSISFGSCVKINNKKINKEN